jgi:hypothetical protein
MKARHSLFVFVAMIFGITSCKKNSSPDAPANQAYKFNYGDSVLYLHNSATDYIVAPAISKAGTYDAFPKGLSINATTGAINVSQSETGMRYQVRFTATTGEVYSTNLLIAGINYLDKYYNLSQGDSIAYPIYNGDPSRRLPTGNYDVGRDANHKGVAVHSANGQINLMQCLRNGLFGNTPKTNEWEDITIRYTTNDGSGTTVNSIGIIIYYYNTVNDVPEDVKDIVQAHQGMVLGTDYKPIVSSPLTQKNGLSPALLAKPRPPCVIIVGH